MGDNMCEFVDTLIAKAESYRQSAIYWKSMYEQLYTETRPDSLTK